MDQPVPPSQPVTPEKGRGPGKITNSLVALGSAAVFTVYAAGYLRTRAAAARFAVEAADLRTAIPPGATAGPPVEAEAPVSRAAPLDLATRMRRNRKAEWARRMVRENAVSAAEMLTARKAAV